MQFQTARVCFARHLTLPFLLRNNPHHTGRLLCRVPPGGGKIVASVRARARISLSVCQGVHALVRASTLFYARARCKRGACRMLRRAAKLLVLQAASRRIRARHIFARRLTHAREVSFRLHRDVVCATGDTLPPFRISTSHATMS